MKLYTNDQYNQLIKNGYERGKDHYPVIKLFLPGTGCTWLITELDPEETSIAFGLCDLGMGFPELGYVSLDEITSVKTKYRHSVERDLHFSSNYPISVYANAARFAGQITEIYNLLECYNRKKHEGYKPQ